MFHHSSMYKVPLAAVVLGAELLLSACGGESISAFEAAAQAAPQNTAAQQAPAPASAPAPARAPAPPPAPTAYSPPPVQQSCANCGVVSAINAIATSGQSTGIGAAVGALVGGLVGNQIGGGDGKKVATVAGVVGGAYAGNKIEQRRNGSQELEVVVTMDNGGQQRIRVYDAGGLSVGSRVSVEGNTLIPR
jgi:outer membrane lipoprotein SlyB